VAIAGFFSESRLRLLDSFMPYRNEGMSEVIEGKIAGDTDAQARAHTGCRPGAVRRDGVRRQRCPRLEDPARRAFYAGAQSILDILLAGLDPENKVTEGEDVEAGRHEPGRLYPAVSEASSGEAALILPLPKDFRLLVVSN
jgi:hypothetical protein